MTVLVGFWARAQAWLRHAISALPADARAHAARARFADAGLLGEAPHPASLSLRAAFDASPWVGITSRFAHGRMRAAQRLPMGRRYPPACSRAAADPGGSRSLWRLRFAAGIRWRSRPKPARAPSVWPARVSVQDVGMLPHSDLGPGIAGARLRATAPLRDVGPFGVASSQGPDPARKPGRRAFARGRFSAPSPCRAGPAAMPRDRPRPRGRRLCRTC